MGRARHKSGQERQLAGRFAPGAMVCPACRRRTEEPYYRCPHCGFTGSDCVGMFPFAAPALEELIDPRKVLDDRGRAAVARRIARLRRRFPQVRWSICLVGLPAEVNLRLFGFWLLNSARPPAADPEAPAWTVLLVADVANDAAGVTAGYAVEPYVADEGWRRALQAMAPAWRRGAHAPAVCEFLGGCGKELATGGWRAKRLLDARRKDKA